MTIRGKSCCLSTFLVLSAVLAMGRSLAAGAGAAGAAAVEPPAPARSAILAHVGKGVITSGDLDAAIAGLPSEEQLILRTRDPLREYVAALIDQRLMADAARHAGMDRDESQRMALQPPGEAPVARDATLATAYLDRRIAALPPLDDAVLREYYAANVAEFSVPQRLRAERLVFNNEQSARAARNAAGSGVKFGDLLKRDSRSVRSFDTVWLQKPQSPSPLDDAIFRLATGQVSDVLPLGAGFLLVKVLDIAPSSTRPFEQVRDGIYERLAMQRREETRKALSRELRATVTVTVDESAVAHYQWRGGTEP